MVRRFASKMISGGHNGNHDAVARAHLLDVGDTLLVAGDGVRIGFVVSGEHHHRKILVDQRVRAMLHLAGRIAFGVNVGNFLELQRAFQGDGEVNAFVEATPISGPACVKIVPAASRVTIEPMTLQIASVGEPFSFASRCPASVSAVSPDWLMHTVSVLLSRIGSRYRNSLP